MRQQVTTFQGKEVLCPECGASIEVESYTSVDDIVTEAHLICSKHCGGEIKYVGGQLSPMWVNYDVEIQMENMRYQK
jgi:hypothetical protein